MISLKPIFIGLLAVLGLACGQPNSNQPHNKPNDQSGPTQYSKPSVEEAIANARTLELWDAIVNESAARDARSLEEQIKLQQHVLDERNRLNSSGCSLGFKMAMHEYNKVHGEFIGRIKNTSVPVEIMNALGHTFLNGKRPGEYTNLKRQEIRDLMSRLEKARIILDHSVDKAYP